MSKSKKAAGGTRPGPGCPPGTEIVPPEQRREVVPFRLRGDLLRKVREQGGRDWLERLIEAAINGA